MALDNHTVAMDRIKRYADQLVAHGQEGGSAFASFLRLLGLTFGGVCDPISCKSFTILTNPKSKMVPNGFGGMREVFSMAARSGSGHLIQLEIGRATFKAILRDCQDLKDWKGLDVVLTRYPSKTNKKEIASTRRVQLPDLWYLAGRASNYGQDAFPSVESLDLPLTLRKDLGLV